MNPLHRTAQAWAAQDPDAETREYVQNLLAQAQNGDEAAEQTLHRLFDGRIQFGTAGLRGEIRAGSTGMNRVLVCKAAKGLADYLCDHDDAPSIVIGYDGRKNSFAFAKDTAEIMAAAGIETLLLPRMLPTPILAFAIRHFNTTAGIMVTASHNPAQDNGYKIYLGKQHGGGQIVPPADKEMAQYIDRVFATPITEFPRSSNYRILDDEVVNAYIAQVAPLAVAPECDLNYVYTALHGVGKEVLLKTLAAARLPLPHIVAEQAEPDAAFPTVAFPNPEEKGAMDLAFTLAKRENAEFILANDPDADRLAVAIPDESGHWRTLHGNLVGCLLARHIAKNPATRKGALGCTIVSTPALAQIAQKYGFEHAETLTGFKYIARIPRLVFGFEESLGYLVNPDQVGDKDGISAAVAFLDYVRALKAEGKTIADDIRDFYAEFGAFASGQISIRVQALPDLGKLMDTFRRNAPEHIGTRRIVRSKDYLHDADPNNILSYYLDDGSRMILRPSGTEPKLKIYLDVKGVTEADAEQTLAELDRDVRALLRSDAMGRLDC